MSKFKDELENNMICSSVFKLLKWGNYIGNLDELISEKKIEMIRNDKNILIQLKVFGISDYLNSDIHPAIKPEYEVFSVIKFKNDIPLILDITKKMFCIYNCDYVIGKIEGEKYLIYKNDNNVSLNDYLQHNEKRNISYLVKLIFVFNWIMCVKNGLCLSYENNIFIKSLNPFVSDTVECKNFIQAFSINENNFTYDADKVISPTILNKWFDGEVENFYNLARNMLNGINADVFRGKFKEIINFYNPEYIPWSNTVYERISFIKNMEL
jgi:hypothetical protein